MFLTHEEVINLIFFPLDLFLYILWQCPSAISLGSNSCDIQSQSNRDTDYLPHAMSQAARRTRPAFLAWYTETISWFLSTPPANCGTQSWWAFKRKLLLLSTHRFWRTHRSSSIPRKSSWGPLGSHILLWSLQDSQFWKVTQNHSQSGRFWF